MSQRFIYLDNFLDHLKYFFFFFKSGEGVSFTHTKHGGESFKLTSWSLNKDGSHTPCPCPQQRWLQYFLSRAFACNKDGVYGTGSLRVWIPVVVFFFFFFF